jgi:hypothetical protein
MTRKEKHYALRMQILLAQFAGHFPETALHRQTRPQSHWKGRQGGPPIAEVRRFALGRLVGFG